MTAEADPSVVGPHVKHDGILEYPSSWLQAEATEAGHHISHSGWPKVQLLL